MTRNQYETTVKVIMETTTELLKKARNNEEAVNIMTAQSIQLQAIADAYMNSNK